MMRSSAILSAMLLVVSFPFAATAQALPPSPVVNLQACRSQKWQFPHYLDATNALKSHLRFHALPYTIIIDRNGSIIYRHTGYVEGEIFEKDLKRIAGK